MRYLKQSLNSSWSSRVAQMNKIDIAFSIFVLLLAFSYYYYISAMVVPRWDGAAYLENAQNWIRGEPIFEPFRPQLLSWIMGAIWIVGGENWEPMKYLQAGFTVGAGVIFYITLRKYKGGLFAFAVVSLTMLNAIIFNTSAQIYTEGIALFFLVLTLYIVKSKRPRLWPLSGISAALTFAARYPIIIQALAIVVVETIIQRNHRIFARAMMGAVPIISLVVIVIFLKTGAFQVALDKDSGLTTQLSPFYVLNSISIWGYAILLVPIAFLFKRTFRDKYNYTFIAWFLVALIFWSANATNHQERFTFQFTPAVYFLAILAIENIMKSNFLRASQKPISGSPIVTATPKTGDSMTLSKPIVEHSPNSKRAKRVPIPNMPGYYNKEGEPLNVIYQEGYDD